MNRVEFKPSSDHFPFESRFFQSSVGRIHYLDEGKGPALLLMHGNPDWSFIYRKIVPALREHFRCIVPDMLGFGLSDHPDNFGYTPGEHAAAISELVAHLNLDDLYVMGQDWGGPVGMSVASEHHHKVRGLIMGNTWYWPAKGFLFWMFSKGMGLSFMQKKVIKDNFFVEKLMPDSLQVELSKEAFDHYRHTTPAPQFRRGIAEAPRQITAAKRWLTMLETNVHRTLKDVPVLLIFGRKDPMLGSKTVIERWKANFADHTYFDLPDAGHFIQEDAPQEVARAILSRFGNQEANHETLRS